MIKYAAILALLSLATLAQEEGCKISLFDVWDPMVFSAWTLDIVYPDLENPPGDRNLTIPPGGTVLVSCKGGRFRNMTTKTILATCNQDHQFEVEDAILDLNQLDCINFEPVVAKITSYQCASQAILIEVGFQLGLNIQFIPQIIVCFDVVNLTPLYVNYNITKAIGFIKSYLTTSYVYDSVYNVSVNFDQIYNFTYQQQIVNNMLGLPVDSSKYIDIPSCQPQVGVTTPGFCFSMRALAYRGNFVYVPQHYATYRYINVAPQWYFLDYNLDKLDNNIRDYVKATALDLEVFAGTYGIATLPHETTGEAVELYLYDSGNVKVVPVPLLFWKLIYDILTERATVFFTVNNPYTSDVSKNVICDDVSDQITWLTVEKHNVTKGYTYACSYQDAKAAVTYLPDIDVVGLLI